VTGEFSPKKNPLGTAAALAAAKSKSMKKLLTNLGYRAYIFTYQKKPKPSRGGGGKPRVFSSAKDSRVAWDEAARLFCWGPGARYQKIEQYIHNFEHSRKNRQNLD
jgi:hypothetical protein